MIALLLFLLSVPVAFACDDLKIQNLNNVDFSNDPSPTETIQVRRSGREGCDFFVTVDNGGASSASSRRLVHESGSYFLPAQICIDGACARVLKHFPEATSSADVLSGTFPENNSDPSGKDFVFRPRLGLVNYERFGDYEANFTMRLYSGTMTGQYSLKDTESFRLRYRMNKRIDLSIVSAGFPFDPTATSKAMNFGTLASGQQMSFDLMIKTNAGYRVRLSSQNNGALKHSNGKSSVPYTLVVGGTEINLLDSSGSPAVVTQGPGVSGSGGIRLPSQIKIGSVAAAQAGNYQDTVTITVSTTE